MTEKFKDVLCASNKGFYLPDAKLIWEGKKKLIVKGKNFKDSLNKLYYLVDKENCYGIVRITKIFPMTEDKFKESRKEHLLSQDFKDTYWKDKEILFGYKFDIIKKFDEPKTIVKELIKDIKTYDPSKVGKDQLADDWRIVTAWYSTLKSGKEIKYSEKEIVDLAKKIYKEIKKRVKEGKMKHEFKPDEMSPHAKDLYNRVSTIKNKEEYTSSIEELEPILNEFKDFKIIKNFISLIGSNVKREPGHVPNDIDLLIRMRTPPDYVKRAVEVRLLKMLPDEIGEKIHFVWGDPEGSHDSFVPLYDLQLARTKPEIVDMSEFKPFKPMKPSKRFYDVDDCVNYMFKTGKKFALEKKYNGFRGVIVKRGDSVKIYSDQAKDITFPFPTAEKEAKQLSSKDFVIDCEIVPYDASGNPLGRSFAAKYIGAVKSHKDVDDSKIIFHKFDLIEFDSKDLSNLPWNERKHMEKQLHYTKHIKEVFSLIVDTPQEAKKGINMMKKMKGSEGCMIKRYEGKYHKNGESDDWIKFRNELELHVRVLEVHKTKNAWNYTVGIDVREKDKSIIKENYLDGNHLILGKTFNTEIKANVSDLLDIHVEEVWRHEYPDGKIRYSIHKPKVMGRAKLQETSTIDDLDAMVVARGALVKENSETPKEEKKPPSGEGETRGEAAVKFWKDNWHNMYPASGGGKFIFHMHWRGLTEEETKLSHEELLNTNNSIHGDLRCQHNEADAFGWTIFEGSAKDIPKDTGSKFIKMSKTKQGKLEVHPKLRIPIGWLSYAIKKPGISSPGSVGATTNKWAKFFALDWGTYKIGVWREHAFELFLDGHKTKGRCIIEYAPIGDRRVWLVTFPEDQTPYADTHDKDKVIKELKSKGQKYLIWAKPGIKPEKIVIK